MDAPHASEIIRDWPEDSRDAARLVLDQYGEPHEMTESSLVWHEVGPYKRLIATKAFWQHDFPAPHIDAVESVIDYKVSAEFFTPLAEFDGSVVVERTAGEVSARCHDVQANNLALNLMHDVVTGGKSAAEAREYYAKEFLDYRRKQPTPYMDELHVPKGSSTPDPDTRVLSDDELERAKAEGKTKEAVAR